MLPEVCAVPDQDHREIVAQADEAKLPAEAAPRLTDFDVARAFVGLVSPGSRIVRARGRFSNGRQAVYEPQGLGEASRYLIERHRSERHLILLATNTLAN